MTVVVHIIQPGNKQSEISLSMQTDVYEEGQKVNMYLLQHIWLDCAITNKGTNTYKICWDKKIDK